MISYELAKQLKDAGFIQKEKPDFGQGYWYQEYGKDLLYIPTLSELIEECGDMFGELIKYDPDKGHLFVAVGEYPRWEMEADSKVIRTIPCLTPEEAVTNLWLELKKK